MTASSTEAVTDDILRLTNEVHALARAATRPDLADLLAGQAARWGDATTTVVLAGAQKRGKSRLLNAVVGRPDLLPVDADIASHTHVALVHGDALAVVVHRESDGVPSDLEIDPAELGDYASMLGDPRRRAGVTGVDVTLPEVFPGLRLVDTPGVDSLTLGHRHATTAALTRADALLFAVSAQDQPVLRHELEFLAEAAERLRDIAFVLTKIEDSTAWQQLLAENRERLGTFVEQRCAAGEMADDVARRLRDAPWLPVSAKLAEAAVRRLAAGEQQRAAALAERSGMGPLHGHLKRCVARRTVVRAGGVLALAASVLRALGVDSRDAVVASSANDEALTDRRSQIDSALADLARRQAERKLRAVDHQLLGHDLGRRATARLEAYRRAYEREIGALSTGAEIARYADGLAASIEQSLDAAWTEARGEAQALVVDALDRYLAELGVESVELALGRIGPAQAGATDGLQVSVGRRAGFDMVGEGLPAAMMAGSAGWMTSALLGAAVTGLGAVLLPVAVGATVAATFVRHRREREQVGRDRAALQRAVHEAFTSAAGEMTHAVQHAVARLRAEAEQSVDLTLGAQKKALEKRRIDLNTAAKRDAEARATAVAEAEDRLVTITELEARAEALGARLATDARSDLTAPAVP